MQANEGRIGGPRRPAEGWLGAGMLGFLALLLVPPSPRGLDLLLVASLTGSVALLVLAPGLGRAVLARIVIATTLLRLGLNIASTRMILDGGSVGTIVPALGRQVAGTKVVAGSIVFFLFVLVQLVFVFLATRRTSRDATKREWRSRGAAASLLRAEVVLGLVVVAVDLVGGVALSSAAGAPFDSAAQRHVRLAIGDGLVMQLPAVLSAAALTVDTVVTHGARPKLVLLAAAALFAFGLLPGLPSLPFSLCAIALLLVWRGWTSTAIHTSSEPAPSSSEDDEFPAPVDRVVLALGARLYELLEDGPRPRLTERVERLRRDLAASEGTLVPRVRVLGDAALGAEEYQVRIAAGQVARGRVEPDLSLAIEGETGAGIPPGRETADPVFGLPARWIAPDECERAERAGCTVVDPASVIVTHVGDVLRSALPELLTRDDVHALLANLRHTAPAVVEEVERVLTRGELQRVLASLLRDGVPVRNLSLILECLADGVATTRDADELCDIVRARLGCALCERHADSSGTLHAVRLGANVEARLAAAVRGEPLGTAYLEVLVERVGEAIVRAAQGGRHAVLLARSNVRRMLSEVVRASLPRVSVLSYNEVVPARAVETAAIVTMEE